MRKIRFVLCALSLFTFHFSLSTWATTGALTGQFTINAEGDYIFFSQGNLQYQASTDTWRFAGEQYSVIGDATGNNTASGRDTQSDWIDLFGWGTGDAPYKATTANGDYSTFTDWGTNAVSNGSNTAGLWRTLTRDEWVYVIRERSNASNLRGLAMVNGVKGYILLSDEFVLPEGCSFVANPVSWTTNSYTSEQWNDMQTAGAVFLPCGGYRNGTSVSNAGDYGSYWAASLSGSSNAYSFYVADDGAEMTTNSLFYGRSIRLVLPSTILSENDEPEAFATKMVSARQNDYADIRRTLRKAGCFNTLCLPFNVPDIAASPLGGDNVAVYSFSSAAVEDGTLVLDIEKVSSNTLSAGTPYLIEWDNTGEVLNLMHFTDVTWDSDNTTDEAGTGDVAFIGFYAKTHISDETNGSGDHLNLFLGAVNELYWPSDGWDDAAKMLGFRAYFSISVSSGAGAPIHRGMPAALRIRSTPTDAENISDSYNPQYSGKFIRDGQLIIYSASDEFSITGQKVR